jgi:hypothetical protein
VCVVLYRWSCRVVSCREQGKSGEDRRLPRSVKRDGWASRQNWQRERLVLVWGGCQPSAARLAIGLCSVNHVKILFLRPMGPRERACDVACACAVVRVCVCEWDCSFQGDARVLEDGHAHLLHAARVR